MARKPFHGGMGKPQQAPLHPNPAFRHVRENQHYGTVDKHGDYHPPRGGMLPTRTTGKAPRPGKRK